MQTCRQVSIFVSLTFLSIFLLMLGLCLTEVYNSLFPLPRMKPLSNNPESLSLSFCALQLKTLLLLRPASSNTLFLFPFLITPLQLYSHIRGNRTWSENTYKTHLIKQAEGALVTASKYMEFLQQNLDTTQPHLTRYLTYTKKRNVTKKTFPLF